MVLIVVTHHTRSLTVKADLQWVEQTIDMDNVEVMPVNMNLITTNCLCNLFLCVYQQQVGLGCAWYTLLGCYSAADDRTLCLVHSFRLLQCS